jgi:uncharacterized membrane-anchored protein
MEQIPKTAGSMGTEVDDMIRSKIYIIIALLIPIVVFAYIVGYKNYMLKAGPEIIIPISGYDPRDLLSGHYLTYNVDYGIPNTCNTPTYDKSVEAYICLDDKTFSYNKRQDCQLYIRGYCQYHRFVAGIEKFYIPEEYAIPLDKQVRDKKASIVIVVPKNGQPLVKDLLIDGKSYRTLSNQP